MNKFLMGASVGALSFANVGFANANEPAWNVDLGGSYTALAVFTSEDDAGLSGDHDGFDIITDSEVFVRADIVLDNQLEFGAIAEFETGGDDAGIDDTFAYVDGFFGTIQLGNEGSSFGQFAKGFGGVADSGVSSGTFIGNLGRGSADLVFTDDLGNVVDVLDADGDPVGNFGYAEGAIASQIDSDAVRINYNTPRFAGLQVGLSYARGGDVGPSVFEDRNGATTDIFSIAANYEGTIGADGSFAVSAGYETADGDDLDRFNLGAEVNFQGFRLSGAYAHYETDISGITDAANLILPAIAAANGVLAPAAFADGDTDFFTVGVGYGTGPWTVGLDYAHNDGPNHTTDQIAVGASYDLGPGVALGAHAGYVETDIDTVGSFDGFGLGTGMYLSF